MQKRKKKICDGPFFPCGFHISGDKKGGKTKWFCFFSLRGEGKCEINYKKKNFFFLALGSFFTIFGR